MRAADLLPRSNAKKETNRRERALTLKTRLGVAELSLGPSGYRVKLELLRPDGAPPWLFLGSIGMPDDPYGEGASVSIRGEIKDKNDYKTGGRTGRKALVDAVAAVSEALAADDSAELQRLVREMLERKEAEAAAEHRRASAAAERWRRRPRALKVSRWRY